MAKDFKLHGANAAAPPLTIDYEAPGPVALKFLTSNAFIRGIRGPIGSGKSVACVLDMLQTALLQRRGKDGIRRYRGVVIRNTYAELNTTTLNTFHQWIPKSTGKFLKVAPMQHHITWAGKDGRPEYEIEFLFMALDQESHVKKLLSLEVTQAWINEAREVPKPILDALTGRVGRYPRVQDGGAVRAGVIMDTNSPDQGHWWAKMADFPDHETKVQTAQLEEELREMGALPPNQPLVEFFTQPSAETPDGKQNPEAENLANLPAGYYLKAKANKKQDWIKVYIRNEYHFVTEGKPVYDSYRDNFHSQPVSYVKDWPLHIGMDFGLTPAAVFAQRSPMGQVRVLSEVVATRLGAKAFAQQIKAHLAEKYPNPIIGTITGDPAGAAAMPDDVENTVFRIMAAEGVNAVKADTNDFTLRVSAVDQGLSCIIDGMPGLVINTAAQELRKGCAGGYHFRKIQVAGEERFDLKPYKNMSSHVCEALQYLCLGLGMGKEVVVRNQTKNTRDKVAKMEYDMYAPRDGRAAFANRGEE